jgi:hypothetical protein
VEVDRHEFREFVIGSLSRYEQEIQALEWIPRVASSQRALYEDSARKTGSRTSSSLSGTYRAKLREPGLGRSISPSTTPSPSVGTRLRWVSIWARTQPDWRQWSVRATRGP